jgi:hypothetical protein
LLDIEKASSRPGIAMATDCLAFIDKPEGIPIRASFHGGAESPRRLVLSARELS